MAFSWLCWVDVTPLRKRPLLSPFESGKRGEIADTFRVSPRSCWLKYWLKAFCCAASAHTRTSFTATGHCHRPSSSIRIKYLQRGDSRVSRVASANDWSPRKHVIRILSAAPHGSLNTWAKMACEETRYSYLVEWRDPRTDVVWKYELYVFPDTKEVEMVCLLL